MARALCTSPRVAHRLLLPSTLLFVGACAAVWGFEEAEPVGSSARGGAAAGGAGAAGGIGGAHRGGAGGTPAEPCPELTCVDCVAGACAQDRCEGPVASCAQDVECAAIQGCVTACLENGGPQCDLECIRDHLDGTATYYEQLDCLRCSAHTCADACAAGCASCSTGLSCDDCLVQPCVADACAPQWAACTADPECLAFADCATPCGDDTCLADCRTAHPVGAALQDDMQLCAVCTKAACYDDCRAQGVLCATSTSP